MSDLSPRLSDIQYNHRFLDLLRYLGPVEGYAFANLIAFASARMVWTYSEPGEGCVRDDDRTHRIAGISEREWRDIRPSLLQYFTKVGDDLYPKECWFTISGGSKRPPMPPALRQRIGKRDNWTCGYCGSTEGPFEIDHVVPISDGGAFYDPENLICACAPCNQSKRAKSVAEWLS